MFKEVFYVIKSNLHFFPPCVSQIKMLVDLGVSVTVLYGSSEPKVLEELKSLGVTLVKLEDPRGKFSGKLDKVNNWLSFRRSFIKATKTIDKRDTIFWFANAETFLPLKFYIENRYKYVVSFLELLDHDMHRIKLLRPMTKKALAVTTCEETRSYIMQYWFGLTELPFTLPNKPYNVSIPKNSVVTTDKGKKIISELQGHRYIIYQGIFQDEKYLTMIAKVLRDHFSDIYFVMMGLDKNNIANKVKAIYPNTIISDYIPAPQHLEITSNAFIGLLFYHPNSLNKAFCAPNKIFEYSNYGLPIIGNSIPGLQNTIGRYRAGYCIDFTYDSVLSVINEIISHYNQVQECSKEFFNSVDNLSTMKKIIDKLNICRNK